jgi:hypothetical protein
MKKILFAARSTYILLLVTVFLATSSIVKADPGANIRVIPVGGVHTGEPIVTTSPAEIMIYSQSHTPIENVWLILAINEDTFNHLNTITADTTTFDQNDFAVPTEAKIPPEAASGIYPGCERSAQYEVNTIKDKLGTPHTGKIYCAYKNFSISTITTTIQTFILTANAPGVTQLRVLVLANGYYKRLDNPKEYKLNEKTPWSNSTLVIPECCGTLLLTIASFAALGFFASKTKKTLRPHNLFRYQPLQHHGWGAE